MKYYGFNPFIQAFTNGKIGIIYDLLEGSIYEVPPVVVEFFSGNEYKSYDEIKKVALKFKINGRKLKRILKEGKQEGIILELNKAYWRDEIRDDLERHVYKADLPLFYSTIWLQPTSVCDKNCSFCNSFINCCCFRKNKEWGRVELENFLIDLKRIERKIGKIEIYGGNIFLYSEIDYLLASLLKLRPQLVNINIPLSPLLNNKISTLKSLLQRKFQITLLAFPAYEDISYLLSIKKELDNKIKVNLLLDEEIELEKIGKMQKTFSASTEFLLKKDLSNIEWYRDKTKSPFMEAVYIFGFYFRKHFHRCWGSSFGVDSEGIVKPCLWSNFTLGHWVEGKIINVLDALFNELSEGKSFGMATSLGNIEGCKDCIFRFGCKDCRVIAEFLTGNIKSKNPLCEIK